ncbi:hypothetical protein TrRE_jg7132 [Triparma retinervis]|uniref:Uncharacterized protein n=1 Tax=Triparma retinervis TaxID=2557542 RepID=A0A9W6ZLQ4_9STRA|nr:hypothetical protein TrRE_jg7132 [Triparma retinervis]
MTFQFPSVVGGLASALKSSQSDANSNSPTNGEVLDILRSSIPRNYLVSYKAAEELRVISTAVKSINIQSRVCNSNFTTAKIALTKKMRTKGTVDANSKIVKSYGALPLAMAIDHAGLLETLLDLDEVDEDDNEAVWKRVDEGAWEAMQRGCDIKRNLLGERYKKTLNQQFRVALVAAKEKKLAEGGLLDGVSYTTWFSLIGPALESRMGEDTVERHLEFMATVGAGGIGGGGGMGGGALGGLGSDGGGDGEDGLGVASVHEILREAGVEGDETWAFARMCLEESVLKLSDIFTKGGGEVSPLVNSGVYGNGLSQSRVETLKSGSGVIKSERDNGKWLHWATELIRVQGNGAKVAGPMYWTRLNPTGGGNGGLQEKTWLRYTKVLGCLLAWLVEELKVPSLVDLPSGCILEIDDNLATAWLQLIHR